MCTRSDGVCIRCGMPFFSEARAQGVYFVGIGGVSMSALACLLHDRGVPVRGCDARAGAFTRMLCARNIPVAIGEEKEPVREGIVVYTEAIDRHADLLERARAQGKRILTRAQLLGLIAETYPRVLAVAGCHGKTSATCMLAHVLFGAGLPVTCHIGGEDLDFGNYRAAGDGYFLTEACEFRRSFLTLHGEVAVVLNTDLDHTDCYKNAEELLDAYRQFAASAKYAVVNADDEHAVAIPHTLSFGLHAGDVRALRLCADGERYSFTVTERGIPTVRVKLRVLGRVQVLNALAAYCAARLAGVSAQQIAAGLTAFRGVKRRFERVGTLAGVPVVCDYAHHPAEIAAALSTAEGLCDGTVRVVFQPHTYTRTRDLMTDFVRVLKRAESPVIYRTYAAREPFAFEGSAPALVSRIPEALYVQTPPDLRRRLVQMCQEGDLILVLGAGDIDGIVRGMLDGA